MKRKKYVEDYFELDKKYRGKNRKLNIQKNKKMGKIIFLKKASKRKLIYIALFLCALLVLISNVFGIYAKNGGYESLDSVMKQSIEYVDNRNFINSLSDIYGNSDIIGFLSIKNAKGDSYLTTPFAKNYDSEFYRNHDLYKNLSNVGGSYLHKEINLNKEVAPRNLVIYGSDLYKNSPFNKIRFFNDEEIFKTNNIVEIKFANGTLYYEIFAFLEEKENLYNDKIKFKNAEEFMQYIKYIENNAKYFTNVSEDDDILTISTDFNKLNNNSYKLYAKKIYGNIAK